MQAKPVLDANGKPTGMYQYQGNVANRALELVGKEYGMFIEKTVGLVQDISNMTPEERKARLDELIAKRGG